MTGNITHLSDFKDFDGGYVTFSGGAYGGRITGKDNLGKFDGKSDEGFFVGYSLSSKAFRIQKVILVVRDVSICVPEVNTSYTKGLGRITSHVASEDTQVSSFQNKKDENFYTLNKITSAIYEERLIKTSYNLFCLFHSLIGRTKKSILKALCDPHGIELYRRNFFRYKTAKRSDLIDLPKGHRAIGTQSVKALYGLHQAPRAWYDTLANYLLCNGFQRGKIDQTLFIKRQKGHILLVQIYVDDIIFGSTKKELCDEFEKLMKDKFQMSSNGELNYPFWVNRYILFAVLHVQGLWYSKNSPWELVAYTDSDYAGATQDRKSTTGGC
ncbi:putative ribonuclease H-like domain-containing protein [Tanacetum coccineum]